MLEEIMEMAKREKRDKIEAYVAENFDADDMFNMILKWMKKNDIGSINSKITWLWDEMEISIKQGRRNEKEILKDILG